MQCIPESIAKSFVLESLAELAESFTKTELDDDNLTLNADAPDLERCSSDEYFHHPQLLEKEFFGEGGPASAPGYKEKMQKVAEQVKAWLEGGADWELFYCGEIYPEYVRQFCEHDVDAAVSGVKCPILFVGGEGGPGSTNYESWGEALPADTPHEVVMAKIVNAGTGGIKAHGHASHYWARHALTIKRFFSNAKKSQMAK